MNKNSRAKKLFQKYLNRTASREELDEMFEIFEDRSQFDSVYELFEREWESDDITFNTGNLSLEKLRKDFENQQQDRTNDLSKKGAVGRMTWGVGIAASIAILIGVAMWYFNTSEDFIYETGYGETKEIVLEDKSTVKLNANSKLVWKKDWKDSGIREMELIGEAFFDVVKISKSGTVESKESDSGNMPFRVITPDLTVNVHGTSFNVVSRRQKTDVFLESGIVELELKNKSEAKDPLKTKVQNSENSSFGEEMIIMKPGDAISFSAIDHQLEHINNSTTRDNASWVEGDLVFEDEKLGVVLQKLEDIYGKRFEVKDTMLLNRNVDMGLPYEDWTTVSGLMTLSLEIEMKEVNDIITVERKKGN